MKPLLILLVHWAVLLTLTQCEPPPGQRPLVFNSWPPKNAKQLASRPGAGGPAAGKQRTLVVQIRSDQPVPLVLKGRPNHGHGHAHAHTHAHQLAAHTHPVHAHVLPHPHTHAHLHAHTHHLQHLRLAPRPLKLSAPVYLKQVNGGAGALRKPLKIKLNNSKPKAKPTFGYDKPFKYEKPTAVAYSELQHLPLDTHNNFNTEHFAPIYTVPAPNLALHDNHLELDDGHPLDTAYLPPATTPAPQQTYLPPVYSVHEDETNDQTIRDPISGSQKLFAPDPDPSLPAAKLRQATEPFNTPSNNRPLPADVQSNHLPAQPIVQIFGAQAAAQTAQAPEIYPIQYTQPVAQLQPYVASGVPAAAHIPIYNPTYLVTQSNQLYNQHKQQLFKPSTEHVIETGYVNADLTQEVASNGQILQAAKDPHHNIHPVLDAAPQYAALIAAPSLGEPEQTTVYETAAFHLPNVASAVTSTAPEGGFVVSNYYGNSHDSSQLLQAYAEEEARRQQLETEQAALELQQQQQLHLEQLKSQAQEQQQYQLEELRAQAQLQQQQQQFHLEELRAHAQEQHLQQQHQQQQQQQQQLQLVQLQQQQQQQLQQPQSARDPAAAAFEEHQRLVQQQLGGNTPLRIFVPDEELAETQRLQKRSDNLKKGIVEDVRTTTLDDEAAKDIFEVSTSVEVAGEQPNGSNQ
ncbi:uncharacterized protein Dwil_GK10970 [Drosophila willistoni]|uniref:Uncharacterized protein n=1 Tax=Drosophila willistoni TaxID=7260 RepID=B4N8T4_DROWI|nr:mastermind-like protein 2 [Drosophila willistoni]EDW81535.1 uncharacterized protein Dwil_GK10970 [Drosophila willistoni]